MSRKRTTDAPCCSRDTDEELPEPLVKMRGPLRKSQSLRAMAAPVVALARQLAELNAEQVADSERRAAEEALVVEVGRLETEHREVEEAAVDVREEHVVALQDNSMISAPHPSECIPPKRCKATKRTVVHFLKIEPQLSMILNKVLPTLVQLHREIHSGEASPKRSETSSFPRYKRAIETPTEFNQRKIKIILTLNFDGVRLKKLSRLREELAMLSENGVPIIDNDTTWFCTPVLANGVIDFAALKTLYDIPRGQSLYGCHLCTFPGERVGHRVLSFVVFPLAAAMNICADPVGAVAVLAYWILVRVIERSTELTINDFLGVRELARGMKYLWYAVEPTLFTLKVHACDPAHIIQEYTYRMSGRYQKKPHLKDLPAEVADSLIGCCLDGLNLYASEMDANVEGQTQNPTRNNDTARAKALHTQKDLRMCWGPILRGALARAL
ncbi:hypothetical protein TELCIR_08929 [Teladorsagia circumcincta]|uniref:Uncharacterized protein n=1 Tax=Teladorsagia circumcincta TaxID=45464 RepID=A0A2G9UG83_TELCI|nr:hypothetical protein TELCIR_08929 [Teladorsagia circumcincta]